MTTLACAGAAMLAVFATSVVAAPKAKTMSPGKVAALMKQAKFQVSGVYRKGPSYVVRAKGPTGNDVLVAVDGKTGKIIGLDVVKWAPNAKRVKRGSRGKTFTGDVYEFGVSISLPTLGTWVVYDAPAWSTTTTTWIEVETVPVTWTEVVYEETVTEVTYETYTEEYQEDFGYSLEEEVTSYEAAEESFSEEVTEVTEVTTEETVVEETVTTEETTETVEEVDDGPADDGEPDDMGGDDGGGDDDGPDR